MKEKKEKPVKAVVPNGMEKFLHETPVYIVTLSSKFGKTKSMALKCASALLAKPAGWCLAFTYEEFKEFFGTDIPKKKFSSVKKYLKESGVIRPKVVQDNDRIYITRSDV